MDTLEEGPVVIVPATRRLIWAAILEPANVAEELGARLESDWDHGFYEEGAANAALNMEEGEEGWWFWWITERRKSSVVPALVGITGFKGPPTSGGTVELLYGLAPSARGRGLGSVSAQLLIDWAFHHPEVERVVATIRPDNKASQRLARKCGLSVVEHESYEGYCVYVLNRKAHERHELGNLPG